MEVSFYIQQTCLSVYLDWEIRTFIFVRLTCGNIGIVN